MCLPLTPLCARFSCAQFGYDPFPASYYDIGFRKKLGHSSAYVGIIGALITLMAANNTKKKSPRELGYQGKDHGESVARFLGDDDNDGDDTSFFSGN